MRRRLHLTDSPWDLNFTPPAPLPFPGPDDEDDWSPKAGDDTTAVVDDVLHTLDCLSMTLEDLRREIDEMDTDGDPPPAA